MKKIVIILAALLALFVGVWSQQQLKVDFTTLDGQGHRWSHSQGKWKVVNYFAEWCAPCLREMPELNQFYQQHNENIEIFAVSFDPLDNSQLKVLQQKYTIQFPIIERLNTLPWGKLPSSLPTTYVLDADGKVQKQLKGEQSAEKLIQTINQLKGL
ncbi:TlpA disulfide reductase family protein [uncultured Paraglaciecola sp.]|uniref:TlpA family protein disulfide reductase n=1 Tax=uncultured Paraglaciecola sp. TaxID=1765024 RepID=UPI0025E272FF|nr:TlpA disulfide reductase family protein [uncultured Paraglaciecola sp.]